MASENSFVDPMVFALQQKYLQELLTLQDRHSVMLSKLYSLKARLIEEPPAEDLILDPQLAKIRYRVDKKFPVLVDLSQSSGFSKLLDRAGDIIGQFDFHVRALREVSLHMMQLQSVIQSVQLLNVDCRFNRTLLCTWIDAVSAYVKISLFIDNFPEMQPIVHLFFAARSVVGSIRQTNTSAADFNWFQTAISKPRRHLYDTFAPMAPLLLHAISEIKPTLSFYFDFGILRTFFDPTNCEIELSDYHLSAFGKKSCLFELSHASQYADGVLWILLACPSLIFDEEVLDLVQTIAEHRFILSLFRDLTINLHTELEGIFASYPTPQDPVQVPKHFKINTQLKQLSRQSVSNAGRKQVQRRRLLISYLADTTQLIKMLPGAIAPKSIALMIACEMLQDEITVGCLHSSPFACRRDTKSYLHVSDYCVPNFGVCLQTLRDAVSLLAASNDLVRQFFKDQLLEVDFASFKNEVLPFLQALTQRPSQDMDSNSRILSAATYSHPHRLQLNESLLEVNSLLEAKLRDNTTGDNVEGASGFEKNQRSLETALLQLINELSFVGHLTEYPTVSALTMASNAIAASSSAVAAASASATGGSGNTSPPKVSTSRISVVGTVPVMRGSVLTAAGTLPNRPPAAQVLASLPPMPRIPEICYLLSAMCERAELWNLTATQWSRRVDPYHLLWFPQFLTTGFQRSLTFDDENSAELNKIVPVSEQWATPAVFSYLTPLESCVLNVHPNVIEETVVIGSRAVELAKSMLQDLIATILRAFKTWWSHLVQLESQYLPTEVIKRLDLLLQMKLNHPEQADSASFGLLPGFESEHWAEESLEKLMKLQFWLLSVLREVRLKKHIRVFTLDVRLIPLVRDELCSFYKDKCEQLLSCPSDETGNNVHSNLARFSNSIHKLELGGRVLERLLQQLELSGLEVHRDIRKREIFGVVVNDTSVRGARKATSDEAKAIDGGIALNKPTTQTANQVTTSAPLTTSKAALENIPNSKSISAMPSVVASPLNKNPKSSSNGATNSRKEATNNNRPVVLQQGGLTVYDTSDEELEDFAGRRMVNQSKTNGSRKEKNNSKDARGYAVESTVDVVGVDKGEEFVEDDGEEEEEEDQPYAAIGLPVPLDFPVRSVTFLGHVCQWFEDIVYEKLAYPPARYVYLPHLQQFVHFQRIDSLQQWRAYQQQHPDAAADLPTSTYFPNSDALVELYLQPNELKALVQFLGVYGVRILEARLLGIVFTKMKEIIAIVQRNVVALEIFSKDFCFSVTSAASMEQLPDFVHALRTIGVTLILRQLLLRTLGQVTSQHLPDIFDYLATLHSSMHPDLHDLSNTTSRIAFYSLTHALGIQDHYDVRHRQAATMHTMDKDSMIGQHDFALFESLIGLGFTLDDLLALQRLPLLAAAWFAQKSADHVLRQYHVHYDVFDGNEHLVPIALATLMGFTVDLCEHLQQLLQVPGMPLVAKIVSEMSLSPDDNDDARNDVSASKNGHNRQGAAVDAKAKVGNMDSLDGESTNEGKVPIPSLENGFAASPEAQYETIIRQQYRWQQANQGGPDAEMARRKLSHEQGPLLRVAYRQHLRRLYFRSYLQYGAQCILTRRERDVYGDTPYAAFGALLYQFVRCSRLIVGSASVLEEFLPYDLIAHDRLDHALGKTTAREPIRAFVALPVQETTLALLQQQIESEQLKSLEHGDNEQLEQNDEVYQEETETGY